jgi:hypothetical protein
LTGAGWVLGADVAARWASDARDAAVYDAFAEPRASSVAAGSASPPPCCALESELTKNAFQNAHRVTDATGAM